MQAKISSYFCPPNFEQFGFFANIFRTGWSIMVAQNAAPKSSPGARPNELKGTGKLLPEGKIGTVRESIFVKIFLSRKRK